MRGIFKQLRNLLAGITVAISAGLVVIAPINLEAQQSKKYKSLPWHLVDQYHRMPEGQIFQVIEIDMTLQGDTNIDLSMYLSPLWGKIDGSGFYFGFLSKIFDTRIRKVVGKGAIFSRWGLGRQEDIRVPKDGWSFVGNKATSGEGDFLSVRVPFEWSAGTYSFLMKTRGLPNAVGGAWVDLMVYEKNTGKWIDVGGLRFKEGTMKLNRSVANFVEIFAPRGGGRHSYPKQLPFLDVTFSKPRLNHHVDPLRTRHVTPKNVPVLFKTQVQGDTVTFKFGQVPVPTIRRTQNPQ